MKDHEQKDSKGDDQRENNSSWDNLEDSRLENKRAVNSVS